jgi:hypothetical protein
MWKANGRTDGRRTLTHDKSSHGLWPGELKMNDNREIFEVPGVYEKRIIFCGQLARINLDFWTLDKLLFTNFTFLASTINFWICHTNRLFVFFFSKYIFVPFQAVIQLALVTFVIDDWFSKVMSISHTFNIITMLVWDYSGTSLLWYEFTLVRVCNGTSWL